jgi:NitT/TauT family transport system permease protein
MARSTLDAPAGPDAAPPAPDVAQDAWLRARRRRGLRRRLLPVLGVVGLLVLWWLVVALFDVQPFIAPSPIVVLQTLHAKREVLRANLLPTAMEAVGGFVLGNLAALLLATLFVHHRALRDLLFPVVLVINAIPVVAKAPILVLMLGNGMEPRVVVAALVCFFPSLVNLVKGLESVNPQAMDLMRVLSASRSEIFFRLRLPNALPALFSSLRISASLSVIGAVVGEWIGTTEGIGALIIQATYNFDSPLLYAAIAMSAALSGMLFLAVVLAERVVVRWRTEDA